MPLRWGATGDGGNGGLLAWGHAAWLAGARLILERGVQASPAIPGTDVLDRGGADRQGGGNDRHRLRNGAHEEAAGTGEGAGRAGAGPNEVLQIGLFHLAQGELSRSSSHILLLYSGRATSSILAKNYVVNVLACCRAYLLSCCLFAELCLIQSPIQAVIGKQFSMCALLDQPPIFHHQDHVGGQDR
jgi:hypothetical protein